MTLLSRHRDSEAFVRIELVIGILGGAHPRDTAPAFESAPAPEHRPYGWAGLRREHRDVEASAPAAPASSGSE